MPYSSQSHGAVSKTTSSVKSVSQISNYFLLFPVLNCGRTLLSNNSALYPAETCHRPPVVTPLVALGVDFETMLSTDIADVGPIPKAVVTGSFAFRGSLCPILFLTDSWNPGLLQSSLNERTDLSTLDFLGARGCADRPRGQESRT